MDMEALKYFMENAGLLAAMAWGANRLRNQCVAHVRRDRALATNDRNDWLLVIPMQIAAVLVMATAWLVYGVGATNVGGQPLGAAGVVMNCWFICGNARLRDADLRTMDRALFGREKARRLHV